MHDSGDLVVVGAGPAGLSAAVHAAERGLAVILVDAAAQPGGQYWRHPDERFEVADEGHGHHGWKVFTDLRERLHTLMGAGRIDYRPSTQVWLIEPPAGDDDRWTLHTVPAPERAAVRPGPAQIRAPRVILSPGGYDRQLPIPGWDLPGAMAAGGVQAMLKGAQTLAGRRAVVAGTGPFLLPVAAGLADAGATVVAICEAGDLRGWLKGAAGAAGMPSKGLEGAGYAATLLKHRIPYRVRTAVTRIEGDGEVESATLAKLTPDGEVVPGTERRVAVDLVALGWGFTPSMELVLATGAETRVDVDESLVAVVDAQMRSTVSGVYIAGEATGVGGAVMAVAEGELAALAAAGDAGTPVPAHRVRVLQGLIRRSAAFAKTMHAAHPVPLKWHEWLTEDTTVCRCEEVTYGQICRAGRELQAGDARSAKLVARPGMGWCQGRICGFATAKLTAAAGHAPTRDELVPISKRMVAVPIALGDVAADDAEPDPR